MCLYTRRKRSKIAKKDITCYKVLRKVDNFDKHVTPYIGASVNNRALKGEEYFTSHGPKLINKTETRRIMYRLFPEYKISEGFIHTFKELDDAKDDAFRFVGGDVFECIIPKGTIYYSGSFLHEECYCSDKIQILKRVY